MSKTGTKWIEDSAVTKEKISSDVAGTGIQKEGGGALGLDINGLPASSDVADTDYVVLYDVSSGTYHKVTKADLVSSQTLIPKYFSAYESTGGQTIASSDTVITLDSLDLSETPFSWESNSNVVINEDGLYKVQFYVLADESTTDSRSEGEFWLERYDGSTWSEIPGTRRGTYHRNLTAGLGGAALPSRPVALFDGNKIRIVGKLSDGSTTLVTAPNGCGLFLEQVRTFGTPSEDSFLYDDVAWDIIVDDNSGEFLEDG